MGNNSEQFILEISAKIKKDSTKLINELRTELKKVEKESKLELKIDEKKTEAYIKKLRKSINQISEEMNKANIRASASSFTKFVGVLKEGANYSKVIADSLKQANDIAKNFKYIEQGAERNKGRQKSIDENKAIISSEFGVLKKQIAQIEKEANGLTKNKTFKKNLASISEILKNPFDHKNVDFSSYKAVQKYINDIYKQVKDIRTEWSLISDEQIANKNDYVKNNTGKLNGIVKGFKDNSSLLNIDKYKDDFIKMKSLAEQYDLKLKEIGNSSDIAFDITDLKQIEQEFDKLFSKLNSYDDNTINILDSKLNKKTISDELKKIADKDLDKDSTILSYKLDENFNNGIIKLTTDVKKADGEIQKLVYSYDSANGAVKKLTESNKELVNTSKQVSTSFTGSFKDMVKVMTVGLGIEDVIYKLKEGLTLVKDLDTALTEMNKVSNESFSNLQKYAMGSFDEAGLIGTTGLDLQSSTADWMRLGKSMSDAQQLAKDTNVLFNVSEFSNIDAATESMVSMTQAYQEISSNDIVDKLNLVGNNYSMATDELAYSLQRSASALKTAKNDFDEAIALTVAGNSVVQNPEMVAAGVRTISLRMAGTSVAKQELESLGEETDTFLTKSKLNDTLEKLTNIDERGGISLLDDNGNYRSTAKVLMDLADRWAEIEAKDKQDGQNRQNALLEALAGKNRASILASILNDKDLLKTVYEDVSTNFDGSALEENAKQMESIEGHLTQLKNKWQEFWASEGNREFITDILDLAQGIIDLTNAVGGANVVIPFFFAAWSQFGGFELITKGLTEIVTILREITTFGKSASLNKALQFLSTPLKNEGERWKGIFAEDIGKELAEETVESINDNKVKLVNGAKNSLDSSLTEVTEEVAEKGKWKTKLATIFTNIGKFITTPIGAGLLIAGVGLGAYAGYKKYIDGLEEAGERAENAVDNFQNVNKELGSFKESIPNLAKEYDYLRDGVTSTGENLSLTNDEFARYNEITNEIANRFPSLVSGYTSVGNAIINMKNSLNELNTAYDNELQQKAKQNIEDVPLSDYKKSLKLTRGKNNKAKARELMSDIGDFVNKDAKWYESRDKADEKTINEINRITSNTVNNLENALSKNILDKLKLKTRTNTYANAFDDSIFFDYKNLDSLSKSLAFDKDSYDNLILFFEQQSKNNDKDGKIYDSLIEYFENSVSEYSEKYNEMKTGMLTYVKSKRKYYDLLDEQRTAFDSIIMNLSEKDYNIYSNDDSLDELLRNYKKYSKKNADKINALYNVDDLYDEDITVSQVEKKIEKLKNEVSKGTGVDKTTLTDAFKLDEKVVDDITSDIVSSFKNMDKDLSKSRKNTLQSLKMEKQTLEDELGIEATFRNYTTFGNVDLNNRKVLGWTKDNIEKYKDALISWGEKNPNDLLGSFSTVSGIWGTYDGVDIAFTPMLQTKDGVEYLDQTTVDNYISTLMKEVSKDGEWTDEELLKLDATGLKEFEVNGHRVKGLIADIGESAKHTAGVMHYLGEDGAINSVEKEIKKLEKVQKGLTNISQDTLKSNFSKPELENIYKNLPDFQEEILENFQNGLYKYYNSFEEYVLKSMEFISKSSKLYVGENKSFSQLSTDSSSYATSLAELNFLGNDNVKISNEMATTLASYGNEFDQYITQSKDGTSAIITNVQAVKELIKQKQQEGYINAKNSKIIARSEYSNLTNSLIDMTNQLYLTAEAEGVLDEIILANINSSREQLNTIEKNIRRYAQLEQQLLGTSNAFDIYNKAVEYDASNNSYSNMSQMLESLKSAFTSGKYGEETFDAALKGILSNEEYDKIMNIEDVDKRIEAIKTKYKEVKKFFNADDDGNVKLSSLEKFVTTAQSKGLFTGKGLENFKVKDGLTLDDFAKSMGYSKEMIYSMLEEIQKHNANPQSNVFEGFQTSTFDRSSNQIEDADSKILDLQSKQLEAIQKRSKLTNKESKEYKELTDNINKYAAQIYETKSAQASLYDQNTKNVQSFVNNKNEIEAVSLELQSYEDKLRELQKDPDKNSKLISEIELNIDNARERLGILLNEKETLGEPVEIQLTTAKDDLLKQIDEKKQKLKQIIENSNTNTIKDASVLSDSQIIKLIPKLDKKDKELANELQAEITKLNNDVKEINVVLGIDTSSNTESGDSYDKAIKEIKADKKDLKKPVSFKVEAKNASATSKSLKDVKDQLNAIKAIGNISSTIDVKVKTSESDKNNNNPSPTPRKDDKKNKHGVLGNVFALGSNNSNYSSGKTLVGEFGAEMIVDPHSGIYGMVGTNGAEFINMPKDAIIFNHRQTEQLVKTNKIHSRGKLISDASNKMKNFSHALGTFGLAFSGKDDKKNKQGLVTIVSYPSNNTSKKSSSSNKSSSKSNSSSSKETKNLIDDIFDWIEIRLERLSNKTQNWIALAENAISKSVQKTHYTSAINSTVSEISQTKTAYSKYMAQANALIKKSGVKNASAYAKKVREGSLSLQDISNEKLKDFISSYKEMYDKAVECDNAVISLTGELQELSQALYNLPIEHAEKKIEKYSDKMDVLSAKYTNYRAYYTQNPALDEQLALQKSIKSAYASAYKETKSNLSSAKGKINNVNDSALKGLSASQKQKIISYVNEGKEINISNKYSANLKKALANYNAALEANRVASNEAAKASAEYTTMLRENNNAKYENITAYYEYKRSLDEANLSKLDAQIAYRESMGYSAVSKHSEGQKAVFDEMIKYNSDILKQLRQERSFYNDEKLMQMYENGELSREDYFALRSRIQEIDEAIYSTTTAINEARDEIYNLDIKRFDFIIDGVARAIEKFKNIISLKDSRNVDALESDYVSQNKGLISQIETLNKKREAILDEMKYYNVESDKYQELASNLQDVENEVYSKLTELEENKNAIMELRFKPLVDSVNELSEQISDLEHLRDLLSDYTLIDDKGAFTDSGLANILLIAKAIDNTNQQIADYRYALEMLEKNYNAGNLSQQEFTEQSREYVELIQDAVSSVDGYKDALIDLYEEQLKIENDALKESISLRKEALEKKKSYYDYDKTLKTSNKDIVNLKNQIAALEGVNNASAKAEVARLKAQLSEAEEELADTKYDHSVQLQLDGYDEMTKSADEMLNELLEDLKNNAQLQEQVVSNMLNNIVNTYDVAYSKIKDIINSTAVNNTTSNSLNTSGENIANSSTTSPTDRNPSYSGISSSTIESGNSNTSNIESSITNGSLNETNRKVARITTSLTSVSLEVGKTQKLTCTVQPSDAQNKTLSVKSSNTGVATASISGTNITITAKGKGSCTVTVYSNDGGASASVGVTVTAPVVTTPTTTTTTTTKPKTTTTTSTSKTTTSTTTTTKPKTTTTSTKSSTSGYISSLSGNISKSSSSSTVKKVQKALKALGFKGKDGKALTIDGKWGTNTDYAVKSFQKSSKYGGKITADGIIGKNTKAKFKKAGYFKGGIVDTVIDNATFLDMIRANRDDGLITAKLGEGIIPNNMMPDFTKQLEQFNSIPADKIMNSINTNSPSFEINVDKFMEVKGNVDNNCVNDLKSLENSIAKNITKTLTQEFRKLGYK